MNWLFHTNNTNTNTNNSHNGGNGKVNNTNNHHDHAVRRIRERRERRERQRQDRQEIWFVPPPPPPHSSSSPPQLQQQEQEVAVEDDLQQRATREEQPSTVVAKTTAADGNGHNNVDWKKLPGAAKNDDVEKGEEEGSKDGIEDKDEKKKKKEVQFNSMVTMKAISKVCDWSNPEEKLNTWHTKQEHKQQMHNLRQEIQDYTLRRRISDNQTFTTLGIMDKIRNTPRYTVKQTLRESGWNAVIFQQYYNDTYPDHHDTDGNNHTNANDHDDESKNTISNSNPKNNFDITSVSYHTTSRIAQKLAHQQALKVQKEIQFDPTIQTTNTTTGPTTMTTTAIPTVPTTPPRRRRQ